MWYTTDLLLFQWNPPCNSSQWGPKAARMTSYMDLLGIVFCRWETHLRGPGPSWTFPHWGPGTSFWLLLVGCSTPSDVCATSLHHRWCTGDVAMPCASTCCNRVLQHVHSTSNLPCDVTIQAILHLYTFWFTVCQAAGDLRLVFIIPAPSKKEM